MDTLRRYSRGLRAFTRSVGSDLWRWIREDVRAWSEGVAWVLKAAASLAVAVGGVLLLGAVIEAGSWWAVVALGGIAGLGVGLLLTVLLPGVLSAGSYDWREDLREVGEEVE